MRDYEPYLFRVRPEMLQQMRDVAKELDVPLAQVFRVAVRDYLNRMPASVSAAKAKPTETDPPLPRQEWDPEAIPPDMPDPVHRKAKVEPRFKGQTKP
jgi:hypothetical protein